MHATRGTGGGKWLAGRPYRPAASAVNQRPTARPYHTDALITAASTPAEIMLTQITTEWKQKVLKYAYTHVKEWRRKRALTRYGSWKKDSASRS